MKKIKKIKTWINYHKFKRQKRAVIMNLRKLGLTASEVNQWEHYIEINKNPNNKKQYINDIRNSPRTVMYMKRKDHGIMCRLDNRTTFLFEELLRKDNKDWLQNEKDSNPTDLLENDE